MGIRATYRANLTQSVLINFLQNLKVPTEPEINAKIEDLLIVEDPSNPSDSIRLDLSRPILSQKNLSFPFKSELSASRVNGLMGALYSDLNVLYDTGLEIEKGYILSVNDTLVSLRNIESEIDSLTSEINRMLLLTEDTEGTLFVVGDDFENNRLIDLDETEASFDPERRAVSIATDSGDVAVLPAVSLEGATVRPISQVRGVPITEISNPDSFLNLDETEPTLYTMRANEPITATIAIIIETAGNEPIAAKGISILPFILGESVETLIQYSRDGETWEDLPVQERIRRTAGVVNYTFRKIHFRFLKIHLSKQAWTSESNDGYNYVFGLSSLRVLNETRVYRHSSVFQSKTFFPKASDGSPIKFTKAIISDICYEQPPSTSATFYLSMAIPDGNGDFTHTGFQMVSPFRDLDDAGISAVLADITTIDRAEHEATLMSRGLEPDGISIDYRSRDSVGRGILVSEIDVNDVTVMDSTSRDDWIEVWRNVGDRTSNLSINSASREVVPAGWTKSEENFYSTYVSVTNPGGVNVDFGNRYITVNSRPVRGVVHFATGCHHITISPEHWFRKDGFDSVAEFNEARNEYVGVRRLYGDNGLHGPPVLDGGATMFDPFYPYNQRLLIEGLTYTEGFLGERVYAGFERYAAHYMSQVSPFDLDGLHWSDYSKFAIIDVIEGEAPNIVRSKAISMLVNPEASSNDEVPERITVVKRPVAATIAEGITFKAVLQTDDQTISPLLEGYEIKMVR